MMSAMKFRHELSYDAPPDQVFAMLADPASAAGLRRDGGDLRRRPARPRRGEGFTLVIDQLQNTKDLPAFARTFAGESTQAIQREVWLSRAVRRR